MARYSGNENYIIEISTALLTDEVEPGTSEGSIVFGNGDEQITKTAYTLKELSPNTEYYARIKSVNGDKESNWVYLEDGTFKTCKEEQVLVTPSTDNGDIEENPSVSLGNLAKLTVSVFIRKTLLMMKLLNFRKLI